MERGLVKPRYIHLTVATDVDPENGDRFRATLLTALPSTPTPSDCPADNQACALKLIILTVNPGPRVFGALEQSDLSDQDKVYFLELALILYADELAISKDGDLWNLQASGYPDVALAEGNDAAVIPDLDVEASQRYVQMAVADVTRATPLIHSFNIPADRIGPRAIEQLAPALRGQVSDQETDQLMAALTLFAKDANGEKLGAGGRLSEMTMGSFAWQATGRYPCVAGDGVNA